MIIKSLTLKKFRAYKNIKINFDKNMNVIIGQNDIGKSTILEALDIFFGQDVIKIDISDWNKDKESNEIIIGVEFLIDEDLKLIIDSTNPTNLRDEYLLNQNGNLEILKKYEIKNDKLQKEKVCINANYPNISEIPLVNLKITPLKVLLKKHNIKSENNSKSAEIRKALYLGLINDDTEFLIKEIDITKEDAKAIWGSLEKELPLYFLFQSDRANKDSDGDIQNPLKTATKTIVKDFEEEFKKIKDSLEKKLTQIGIDTIDKMKDMGLDFADELTPKVSHKNLDTLFSFSLESDDGIALNKRGSGFRRMVMLNYFRAEAEKKISDKCYSNIIYAIEEPETSQHPNHQILLIEALLELSNKDNHQIIMTTHTPEIAKMVDENNLILVTKDENKNPFIVEDTESKLELIIKTLGILPSIEIKNIQKVECIICMEGKLDIEFLTNINHNIIEYKNIIDIENNEKLLMIPMGGSTIEYWVNKNLLEKLQINQVHIYDSDIGSEKPHKYKKFFENINAQIGLKSATFETKKREMENYIHHSIITNDNTYKDFPIIDNSSWNTLDLGEKLAKYAHEKSNSLDNWTDIDMKKSKSKISRVKKRLNEILSTQLKKEHLEELEAFEEIKGWFEKIKELSE